jgi:hypothetical protein
MTWEVIMSEPTSGDTIIMGGVVHRIVPEENYARILQELNELRADRALQVEKHDAFRAKVREQVLEYQQEHSFCDSGVNQFLKDLDLEPKTVTKRFTVKVKAEREIEVELTGEDESELDRMMDTEDVGTELVWNQIAEEDGHRNSAWEAQEDIEVNWDRSHVVS